MKLALLILTLGSLVAAVEEQFTFIGAIDKLGRNEIIIKTPRGPFKIYADNKTEVAKDKAYSDFSPLKAGDEISVRCRPDGSGKLVALKVFAKAVNFPGTVKDVRGEEIEVVTGTGDEHKIVRLYPDTVFGTNRSDLTPAKQIRVVGLDIGDGKVDASRVALYNTDVPVQRLR
jgi:hypothetical protein